MRGMHPRCFLWLFPLASLLYFLLNPVFLHKEDDTRHVRMIPLLQSDDVQEKLHQRMKDQLITLEDVSAFDRSLQLEKCYKSVECPSSIQNRMHSSSSTKDRFNRNVPLIVTNDSLRSSIYERLQKFRVPFGWKNMTYEEIDDFVSLYNSPDSACLLTPLRLQRPGCVTCAVVGNGGILKGAKQGPAIDDHDYVFRTNLAITEGYEEDVGGKTSVYVFSLVTLENTIRTASRLNLEYKSAPSDEGVVYLAFGAVPADYAFYSSLLRKHVTPRYRITLQGGVLEVKPQYFPNILTTNNLKMLHPDFMRYVGWSWIQSTKVNITKIGAGYRPTTGAFAVISALHSCDKVDLYGFSKHPENYTEYYFDKEYNQHKTFDSHDHAAEGELWDLLDRTNVVSLYRRGDL